MNMENPIQIIIFDGTERIKHIEPSYFELSGSISFILAEWFNMIEI